MSGGDVLPREYSDFPILECNSQEDLLYTQIPGYLPDGLPIFRVTFTNTCRSCSFFNIHISCGDFASAVWVDPIIFEKLSHGDCLLNNGGLLAPQSSISFEYESTFAYPMAVSTAIPACL